VDALDQLDPRRFDAHEICDKLNEFAELSEAEQDEYLGEWDYAGLEDSGHPFGMLLAESHNPCCVVRDLDGRLKLLWENVPAGTWHVGDLSPAHLRTDAGVGEIIEEECLAIDPALAREALEELEAYRGP
jgi:hypothetical protein